MTEEQVTAVLDGKRVVADRRELLEVTNANAAYDAAPTLRAHDERSLLRAHRLLMNGLIDSPGRFRSGPVGVFAGSRVVHLAPPARFVRSQVRALLAWLRDDSVPALVRSCVAHYELLFIHPFMDGNGRLARLWQQVVLLHASPLFAFVPTESVIRERQRRYYELLRLCDRRGDSTAFVEWLFAALRDALGDTLELLRPTRSTAASRLETAREQFVGAWFSRGDYLRLNKAISTATASRDLLDAVAAKTLQRSGVKRFTRYRFRPRG